MSKERKTSVKKTKEQKKKKGLNDRCTWDAHGSVCGAISGLLVALKR